MIRLTELKLPLSALPVQARRASDAPSETDADRAPTAHPINALMQLCAQALGVEQVGWSCGNLQSTAGTRWFKDFKMGVSGSAGLRNYRNSEKLGFALSTSEAREQLFFKVHTSAHVTVSGGTCPVRQLCTQLSNNRNVRSKVEMFLRDRFGHVNTWPVAGAAAL